MEIKIIIVDDDKNNATELQKIVETFESVYPPTLISYKITGIFSGIYAFIDARTYINTSQDKIDIVLIDYHLKRGLGTDLFRLIKPEFKIYKILHSETRDSLMETKSGLNKSHYNDFCYSKNTITIHEAFQKYEKEILKIKLFGNPEFRAKYFINENRLTTDASKEVYNNINIADILYILSEGEDIYKIFYRDKESGGASFFLDTKFQTFQVLGSEFSFRRVNNKTIVNLLWVADIDINSNLITFILLNNQKHKIKYNLTSMFKSQISPHLKEIKQEIPDFFCD